MTKPKPKPALEPPDLKQCQTMRPNTWPDMPSIMTMGPVSYHRCTNKPVWLASDGVGEMSLCQECYDVCEKVMRKPITYTAIPKERRKGDRRKAT